VTYCEPSDLAEGGAEVQKGAAAARRGELLDPRAEQRLEARKLPAARRLVRGRAPVRVNVVGVRAARQQVLRDR
jgi:hypothetical protein